MHHHENVEKVRKVVQGNMQRIKAVLDEHELCSTGIHRLFKTAAPIRVPDFSSGFILNLHRRKRVVGFRFENGTDNSRRSSHCDGWQEKTEKDKNSFKHMELSKYIISTL